MIDGKFFVCFAAFCCVLAAGIPVYESSAHIDFEEEFETGDFEVSRIRRSLQSGVPIILEQIPAYQYIADVDLDEEPHNMDFEVSRMKRSVQPGAPNIPGQSQNGGWVFNPNVNRDQNGNTVAGGRIEHSGPNHDVHGQWEKVVRGPAKAKPTWNVGGTIRW